VLPVTIVDVNGDVVVVEDIGRIVVLNGDFTEVVFALGLGDNVVAVDSSATYPEAATQLPQVGYQRRLSAEGILSMEPTVVIGNLNAGPPEVLEQVRSTGVPVVILDNVSTIDGAAKKIRGVAQALGVTERGETLAAELETQIEEVKALAAQAENKPTAVFLYMRGLDSLFLIGQDHLSHELFEATGAISGGAAAGVMRPFIPLTAEALAAANPDCIVVLTAGLQSVGGLDGFLQIPGVGQTKAAEQGCIVDFDDQYFGGGGPRMGDVLMDLLRVFHPDLAPAE
jgi:iron complex transport system substrate-binding protein